MPNSDLTFNTTPGQTVGREMLIAYLNTGENETPKWSPIGKRVEDSSSEYDWQTETKVDIFGNTYTNGKKPTITQTFDPCELDADDAAQKKIWNLAIKDQNVNALMNQDMTQDQFNTFMENYLKAKAKEPASDWAKPFIDTAIDVGAMTDVGGTIERPKSWMTREELSVVVAALARKG